MIARGDRNLGASVAEAVELTRMLEAEHASLERGREVDC
jgi:hypothetical protein